MSFYTKALYKKIKFFDKICNDAFYKNIYAHTYTHMYIK